MRLLVLLIILVSAGWSANWFFGKSNRQEAISTWLEERAEAGWVADSDVELQGFPNRYDAVMTNLNLADPASGWAWRAPEFRLLQLSYDKNKFIAQWPNSQIISTPDEKIRISSDPMDGSFIFDDAEGLDLNRATITIENLGLSSTKDWGARAQDMLIALRKSPKELHSYDLAVTSDGFALSTQMMRTLKIAGVMPNEFETLELRGQLGFSEDINKKSFENGSARLSDLKLSSLDVEWGDIKLRAAGDLEVTSAGYPLGHITLRAENWKKVWKLLLDQGVVPSQLAPNIETGLRLLTQFTPNPDVLDIPLRFSNGQTKLGPISLGPAPKITFP